jgi:hypothetical protein
MQEIYAKEETFGISSPRTLEEDHEARQESRHAMNMTQMTRGPKRQRASLQGLNQKQRSLHNKDSSLNREGNDVKGPHASAHK